MCERDTAERLKPMLGHLISDRGIEPKLRFRLSHIEGVTAGDLSFSKIVNRIILGPSVSSPISRTTFQRLLRSENEASLVDKVFASTIPFRSTL